MTPKQQRIAIAEACGEDNDSIVRELIPDYLNDLNAMHQAEKVLTKDEATTYACGKLRGGLFDAVHATASQRAEAFLHTIGKWVSK